MSEKMKEKRKVVYFYNELEQLVGEEETRFEPVDASMSEFAGVLGSLSLPHGQVPPEPMDQWSVYKVYEKVIIWLRHVPVKEAA